MAKKTKKPKEPDIHDAVAEANPTRSLAPKMAVVADVHIGNHPQHGGVTTAGINERCAHSIETFRQAIIKARQNNVSVLFVAGDLFQTRRPEPAVIAAVLRVLVEEAKDLGVVLVPGNHDMLDASAAGGNTAMAPLYREAAIINVPDWVDIDSIELSVFCVPFQSSEPMSDYLDRLIREQRDTKSKYTRRVLVTHVGVFDTKDPEHWKAKAPDAMHSELMLDALIEGRFLDAFVGNFHQHQTWNKADVPGAVGITQVGTLCPHSYGDEGLYPKVGGMLLYNYEHDELVEVEGPRFITVGSDPKLAHAITRAAEIQPGHWYARVQEGETFELPGVVVDVVPPKESKEDASPLPQASDAKSAITEYIDQMQLPDGVSRDAVHAAAQDVWNGTA